MTETRVLVAGGMCVVAALIGSGISPYDRLTWLLEVAPVLIAFPILWFTRYRFPLTRSGFKTFNRVQSQGGASCSTAGIHLVF
ncbi:MAG: hypothetical protein C4519_08440 [Desulfobacteraceae bacterium]|nr:MAG: hypothetical protein C4519_08440 [Desulfobacteraceae bacterium]